MAENSQKKNGEIIANLLKNHSWLCGEFLALCRVPDSNAVAALITIGLIEPTNSRPTDLGKLVFNILT